MDHSLSPAVVEGFNVSKSNQIPPGSRSAFVSTKVVQVTFRFRQRQSDVPAEMGFLKTVCSGSCSVGVSSEN